MAQVRRRLNHLRRFSWRLKVAGVATVKTQVGDTTSGGAAAQTPQLCPVGSAARVLVLTV